MDFCDKVERVGIEGQDINLIDPAQLKKLKKTDLILVVNKYHEIIEDIGQNNNNVVDKLQKAHEAFVALSHCVYGADNPDKMTWLKNECKKVVDKERSDIVRTQVEISRSTGQQYEGESFENVNFEGVDYDRCVGGADNNKVFDDNMDWYRS